MHQLAVAAWIDDVQQSQKSSELPSRRRKRRDLANSVASPPSKARRLAFADVSARASNMASRNIKKDEVGRRGRRLRMPSPEKGRNSSDIDEAENFDFDAVTPRPRNKPNNRPIPILQSKSTKTPSKELSKESITSSTASSAARSRSPKKVTLGRIGNGVRHLVLAETTDDIQAQLGHVGELLYSDLQDVSFGCNVLPAGLTEQLAGKVNKVKDHWLDKRDDRSIQTLHLELQAVETIVVNSKRCMVEKVHDFEWNCIVHAPLLGLALGYVDHDSLGFRNVTSTRISDELRPSYGAGFKQKIVDFVIFLEPASLAADVIAECIDFDESINHTTHEGLQHRPIAVSIETKTESRPPGEAKEQLGVWIAAQVARIELLLNKTALESDSAPPQRSPPPPPAPNRTRAKRAKNKFVRVDQQKVPQQRDVRPKPALPPPPPSLLSDIVFPLIQIQAKEWKLYFARIAPHRSMNPLTLPHAHIEIFGELRLGESSSIIGVYQLLKSLRVLKRWIDTEYRTWWDRVLGVVL